MKSHFTPSGPSIMFDTCKLSIFSISMLQEIRTFYDLDTSFIKAKGKKPYIEIQILLATAPVKSKAAKPDIYVIEYKLCTNIYFYSIMKKY